MRNVLAVLILSLLFLPSANAQSQTPQQRIDNAKIWKKPAPPMIIHPDFQTPPVKVATPAVAAPSPKSAIPKVLPKKPVKLKPRTKRMFKDYPNVPLPSPKPIVKAPIKKPAPAQKPVVIIPKPAVVVAKECQVSAFLPSPVVEDFFRQIATQYKVPAEVDAYVRNVFAQQTILARICKK